MPKRLWQRRIRRLVRATSGLGKGVAEGGDMTVPGFKASEAAGPLEFRLQIVVEVGPAAGDSARSDAGASLAKGAPDASSLPRHFEAARSLVRDLAEGLDVRMATLTWPSGVRIVAQGKATPSDLARIRAAAAALGQESSRLDE
jgi:hypothetical protein